MKIKNFIFCLLGTFFGRPYQSTGMKFALDTILISFQKWSAKFDDLAGIYKQMQNLLI